MSSAVPSGSQAISSAEAVVRAFLVPTAAGAWYAVSSPDNDDRRNVLLALLRGGAGFAAPLEWFTRWTGLSDRRTVAGLLFSMQRAGWLSGDIAPFRAPRGAATTLLPSLLARVGGASTAVLVDSAGLCIAYAGTTREQADLLAARVASFDPRLRKIAAHGDSWSLESGEAEMRLSVRRLHLGGYRFLLVVGQDADLAGEAFVQLMGVLAHHCLGATTPPQGSEEGT